MSFAMQGVLVAAVRDLDPPVGGAERSLASLLDGVTRSSTSGGGDWDVRVMQSGDRGDSSEEIARYGFSTEFTSIAIEDTLSGMAWRLRSRRSGRSFKLLEAQHLKRKNEEFSRWITTRLARHVREAEEEGLPLMGVSQLHWAAGASWAFSSAKIPYVVFVRDELCFQHAELYGPCLEGAAAVLTSGEGFGRQVSSIFNIRRMANVHLPVDFSRLGSEEEVRTSLNAAAASRRVSGSTEPRIALIGVTPEKGFNFYDEQLLPALARRWPEARVRIYGGGGYADSLGRHPNVSLHGFVPASEVFPQCDVHLIRYESAGSWGRVINEAGHFWKPTVCNDIGSEAEAVGPGGVILSTDAPADDWVDALMDVYENSQELGAAAHAHRLIIDHRSSIEEFRSVLEELLRI